MRITFPEEYVLLACMPEREGSCTCCWCVHMLFLSEPASGSPLYEEIHQTLTLLTSLILCTPHLPANCAGDLSVHGMRT